MARVWKVQQVHGDGRSAAEQTFLFFPDVDPQTGEPFVDEHGEPWIALTLRSIARQQQRTIEETHTAYQRNGAGAIEERTDVEAVRADMVCYAIVDWRGFIGADDKPLKCCETTKRALDRLLQNRIIDRALYSRPVEVTDGSFRQPAIVP